MKNKIFTKIILVVVSVSVLIGALVLPSFAYTIEQPSTSNTGLNEYYIPTIVTPDVYMDIDFYANDYKKTSCRFPLFTNSSIGYDNSVFLQVPDEDDYGQLSGYADTVETDIYETGDTNLALLRQVMHNYISPGYVVPGGTNFYYSITSISSNSLYYNDGGPFGTYYSVFIHLDDTYDIGDTISFTRSFDYVDINGVNAGTFEKASSTVTYDDYDQKGVYIFFYNSSILENDWLVTGSTIFFDTPIIIDDYGYNGERGFIRTTSRFICPNNYGIYFRDYFLNSDIDIYTLGFNDGYLDGYSDGETAGYGNGYNEGLSDGYANGYEAGEENGEHVGYLTGYSEGYDEGYSVGYDDAQVGPFQSIINAIGSFLNWQFIPGVSFGILLSLIVGACLLLLFLKIFAGG